MSTRDPRTSTQLHFDGILKASNVAAVNVLKFRFLDIAESHLTYLNSYMKHLVLGTFKPS